MSCWLSRLVRTFLCAENFALPRSTFFVTLPVDVDLPSLDNLFDEENSDEDVFDVADIQQLTLVRFCWMYHGTLH